MRTRWQWVVMGCALLCYAPAAPPEANHGPAAASATQAGQNSAPGPKIRADAPPAEVYRRVKAIADEYLRPHWPRPAEVWRRPWNHEQAFAEFRGLEERVRSLESVRGGVPLVGSGGASRIFAGWQRLKVEGVETACETDAAPAPRGGPEDEVVLGTGEVVLAQTDLSLPARGGVGFSLVRYYRSQVDYNGPLGPGWDHSCNQRIVAEGRASAPHSLVWYTGQRAIRFTRQGDDWQPEPGAFYRLQMEGRQVVVETPERMRLEFEPARERGPGGQGWRIARIAGRHDRWQANVMKFQYWPGSDVLAAVEDPYGNRVRFFHDDKGRLSAVTHGGKAVLYQYDESGRLTQVTVPRVGVRLAHTEDATWQYTYVTGLNGRSWLQAVIAPGGFSEKVFDHQMAADKPGYGRVVQAARRGRDPKAGPEEAVWTFAEERRGGRCTVMYRPPSPLPEEEWTFPLEAGRAGCYPLRRRIPSRSAEWEWKHNSAGQLVEERAPLGGVTRWHYDSEHSDPRFRGNLLAREDLARPGISLPRIAKRGWRWTYHREIALPTRTVAFEVLRDGSERVLQESRFEYDPQDLDLVEQRTGDWVRRIVRNRFGLPVVEWDGRGCATVYRYYGHYNAGVQSAKAGGLEGERVEDATTAAIEAALRDIGWAKAGQMPARRAEQPPCHRLSRSRYDEHGRKTLEEFPGYRVARVWNKLGQLLAVLDSRADLVVYDYNTALRRTGQWRRIERLEGARYLGESRPDAAGYFAVERLAYDALGRLAAWNPTLEPLGLDKPAPPEVRYEYYPSGQLKKRITPAGTAVEIDYDEETGWQKAMRLVGNDKAQQPLTLRAAMTYDAEGFLLSYQDARGETYRTEPDAFGQTLATLRPDGVRRETVRDGLDRPIQERVLDSQGRLLDERRYAYDSSGRLVKVQVHRLATAPDATGQGKPIDQWLVAEETQYDPEGNVLARRGWREGAWEKFAYDGLGRLVWRESPGGDRWQAFYQDDWLCVETETLCRTGQAERPTTFTLHSVTLRDARGQPWCTVPVGHDGTIGIRRARLTHHDSQGNLALELLPDRTKTLRFFNTLGQVEQERMYAVAGGQLLAQTTNRYDRDGLLAQREVDNEPLAFSPLDASGYVVAFERQKVPQVRRLQYDAFRRLWRETAPEGLVQQYAYGPDSRVVELARYHLSEPDHKEVLRFSYDRLGRLKKLEDAGKATAPQTIQQFDYDWQDNLVRAWDYAQPEHTVGVERSYDNLGQLLREQIKLMKDGLDQPAIVFEYDLPGGKQAAQLAGFEGQPAGWRRLEVQQDLAGRVQQINKDGEEFCRLEFIGQQVVAKRLPRHALTEETVRHDSFLEPLEHRLVERERADSPIYRMHYLRDELSRVTASSIRVSRKDWECSKLYDRDSTGNLTADDTQGKFFEPEELEQKRNGLLLVGRPQGPEDIGSHHVRHYEYDQAGNLIALFRGKATKAAGRWPQGTELVSSWNPFSSGPQPGAHRAPQARLTSSAFSESAGPERSVAVAAQPAASKEARLRALASNRPACKATVEEEHARKARLAACYEYDRFGRLANYFSRATGKPLRWQIEYDLLGRVVWMKGFEADPANAPQAGEKSDTVKPGATKPACELRFAYDPFNRRIVKDVRKMANTGGPNTERTVHAMLYTGQRPAVKLRKPADPAKPWIIEGQYLWGAGPSEILAYYERADVASSASAKPMMREHLLHQDVGLNVVLSTHCSLDKSNNLEIGDVASYWGLGENSTTGVIREATSSLDVEKGHEARLAIDRTLDHQSAHWKGADKPESGFLTLKLAQKQRLMAMDVWADKLPSKFRVYVVPEGKGPRRKEEPLSTWENNHKRDKVWDTELARPVTPMKPHTLPLESREGQEIVLAWDSCPGGIQVREFEVFAQPLHPGDLAFSGTIYDAETGLYYHGARYRLPELGTFISPDPLGFFGGDNLYAFAHNDPLTWHDPDGRFAHILLGGGVGGAIGAVSYIWQWWWYGEEWDWARFGIHTAAGVASGALAATTGGASLAWMAGHGFSATSSVVMAGALSGGVGGAMHGAIQAGGITYLETGDLRASLRAAGAAALQQGILGAVGGFVGGGVLGQLGGNFRGFVASGIAGGAVPCGLSSAYEGYSSTGTIFGALRGFFSGAAQGAVVGGTIGAAAWGVGRTTGWIRPLPKQPKGLPDPRQGLLIRTEPKRGDYGGVAVKPGYARHHIKPLSLGGTDTPNNIVELPLEIHRQAHPGPEVNRAPIGTIFY